ncbi:DUF6713 family protein [Xanthomonas bonasiae]|uniref:DUF6713 family protein n=1 Tax=Xanthomonas bonasiae TaxID=2810351 RepID=UPI0017856ED8|nr:DUF6713 family protein [Xanthomonas surreyensis]MBD7923394.1 hypothetical protein [Xanthomonas surreyensis]
MERLYFATALSLILHQIDAAFWQEWKMFAVPGGIQGFLAFNAVAVGALLCGYRSVLLRGRHARAWALACGGLGVTTFILHAGFALADRKEFSLPLSVLAILACLAFGAALLVTALRARPVQ